MALYERLLGRTDAGVEIDGKIPVHGFAALMRLFARGIITGPQAQAAVASISSSGLSASEVTEANTLLATITALTNANATTQRLLRLERAHVIDDTLMLGELGATGFATPSEVETVLGV